MRLEGYGSRRSIPPARLKPLRPAARQPAFKNVVAAFRSGWFPVSDLHAFEHDRTIVTSALPYIHGLPHLGNIVGSILPADLYHRYLDLRGQENIFICGSDEHGTPLELSAIEAGEEPKEHADRQHTQVKEVLDAFGMGFSLYGRTHTPWNEKQTRNMFIKLYRNGYITEKEQNLPYCLECERFLPDRYIEGTCPECGGLARGDQCDDCGTLLEPEEVLEPHCTICEQERIEFRTTKNLFLELSKFEDRLKEWLKTQEPIPKTKRKEVLNLIDDGLEDRCITRDIEWGFDVPHEELDLDADVYGDKVLYVWFDAPIGYIGITRQFFDAEGEEERWREYWQNTEARTVYSIGKDNTIFHSIIFPSMLMGASSEDEQYNLPDHEFIHEYLLSEDVQFSKSRGHGLSSRDALDILPADYWRFYLSTVIPETHDSTFTWDDLETKVNSELNDTVGNFVNRVLTLTAKWFDDEVPAPEDLDRYTDVRARLDELVQAYDDAFEEEKSPKKAVKLALDIARLGDEFLSREEPWKHEDGRQDIIFLCLGICEALALTLSPFIPASAGKLWRMLGHDDELVNGEDRLEGFLDGHWLQPGQALGERSILFEKVDADELAAQLDDQADEDIDDTMDNDVVTFEQFQQLDLRTGTIVDVSEHPNADKLYLVQIDVGGETKQSCAGLRPYFEPDELEGMQVVVVNNLEPTELRGELSECMILAVDADDDVIPLAPREQVANGLPIK